MARQVSSASITDDAKYDVSSFESFTVFKTTAPGSGTPTIQISDDGTTWHDVAAFGAGGYLHVQACAAWVRVHGGSGSPGAYVVRGLYSHDGG